MRFYTASRLGSKRSYTPEGFLVCLDVPIARTGEMIYAGHELPGLEVSRDGLIRVQRNPDEVFKPESMASFVGKPTTNDHPPVFVDTSNFKVYAKGSTQNVRAGIGEQADLILADLIWWDPDTIKAIEAGKDEISNGYDAEYEFVSPGVYRQTAITGNHVALVDEGRCGERCAIGDSAAALQTTKAAGAVLTTNPAPSCGCGGHHHHDAKPGRARKRKARDMSNFKKTLLKGTMLDRLRRTFAAKDEAGFEEAMTAVEEAAQQTEEEQAQAQFASMIGEAVATALAPITERLGAVEADVTDRKTRDAEEEARKKDEVEAKDRAARDARSKGKDSAPSDMGSGNVSGDLTAGREDAGGGSTTTSAPLDPGFNTSTEDSLDLAAFLKAKGLSEGDVAAAVAMIKKDEPAPVVVTGDDGDGPAWSAPGGSTGPGEAPIIATNPSAGSADRKGATDSASLLAAFRDAIAKAEILAPGIKLPAFDAKHPRKATVDAICDLRRRALKAAFDSAERKANVVPLVGAAPDFATMTCDAIAMAFGGAAELAKRANDVTLRTGGAVAQTRDGSSRSTIAEINAAAKDLWKGQR